LKTLVPRQLATGVGFTEGPLIRPNGEIIFTSIDQGKLYKIPSVKGGKCEVFVDVGGGPNGATEGLDGTVYVTQCGGRWGKNDKPDWSLESGIQAVKPDGSIRWISTDPVAPNDLCFGPDGWLYCTDPTRYRTPRNDGRLFRIKVETGEAQLLCSVDWYPNGLGFGPEDDVLYVADSYGGRIVKMPLDGFLQKKEEVFIQMEHGHTPDGFLFDTEGNLITSANSHDEGPGEIHTYDRRGKLVDILTPGPYKSYTNVALAGDKVLVISDSGGGAFLAVDGWPTAGMKLHPFRNKAR
jgi:gluconolactonase